MTLSATKIQVTALDHVVLHVRDLARSRRFYTEALGMPVHHENERQCFVQAGNQLIALFERKEGEIHAGQGMDHIALDVAEGTYETLKSALEPFGVELDGRPDHLRAYVYDPDGHRVQLLMPGHRANQNAG